MKVYVINRAGRYVPGHGSRAYGESFDLPDQVAQGYLKQYPGDYSREPPEKASETPPKKKRGEK